jgi:CMP-N,N'-diacetyllegionaminic acid synthase
MPPPAVLCVIPARGGSKGLPGKNLRSLGGRPLIAWSIDVARRSRAIDRVVVSTDDEEIAAVAAEHGAPVPFLRPAALATDDALQIDVMIHALKRMEAEDGRHYDVVILLQPTTPLRTPEDVDVAVARLLDTGATSVVAVTPASEHPFYMCTLDGDRIVPLMEDARMHGNRQEFPAVYRRNGAVYAVRRDVLLEGRSLYGEDSRAHIMPRDRSVNIDTELDLTTAELLLAGS